MNRLAIDHRTALKIFWNNGYNTEALLLKANELILATPLASVKNGYWYADDIIQALDNNQI